MQKLNLIKISSSILLLCASCSTTTVNKPVEPEQKQTTTEYKSSAELDKIKSLAGKWESTTSMFGKKNQKVYTEYTVTAGGSAVLERIFPGTPHEMVSVYYDDDAGKLSMTHYCLMKNRPHFKLVNSTPNSLSLDVVKVEGVKSEHDASMGAMTLNIEDKNHFSTTCESRGKDKHDPMTMKYTRVKK